MLGGVEILGHSPTGSVSGPNLHSDLTYYSAGPGKGGTIVATGDFNSASDGSTTTSYAQVTGVYSSRELDSAKLTAQHGSPITVGVTLGSRPEWSPGRRRR